MKTEQMSVRLAVAFSLLIVMLVIAGWLGLSQMARIHSDLEPALKRSWAKVQLIRDGLECSNQNQRILLRMFFLDDNAEMASRLLQRSRNREKISEILHTLEGQITSQREAELLERLRQTRSSYADSYSQGLRVLLEKHPSTEMRHKLIQNTVPLLDKYHSAWKDMGDFQRAEIDRNVEANSQSYTRIRTLTVSLMLILGLAAGGVAVFVTWNTAEEMRWIRTEQDLLDALLSHVPDSVYFKDRDSRFVRLSHSLAKRFGLTDPAQAANKTDFDFFTPEHAQEAFADEQEVMRTGKPIVGKEERETWPDGGITWVLTTKMPFLERGGQVIGTIGVSHEITELKRTELELRQYKTSLEELVAARTAELTRANEELAQKAEELARSNTDLEQFAYVASHDLQEPLRMVSSYTQLLARRYKGKLDSNANEFIGYAVDGANRMQTLIHDLLTYSRLTTNAPALKLTESSEACDAAIRNLQNSIKDAKAVVSVEALPQVLGDPTQLGQLFQNLISNAVKYRNKKAPIVRVAAKPDGSKWVFSVHDNGIGIDPQFFERIFRVFQRLHTRKEYPGTGIGLALCRRIVERHGGKIWVESQPTHGSTFLFTMPRVESAQSNPGQGEEHA
jgi:PAS domain S-box-containing protein